MHRVPHRSPQHLRSAWWSGPISLTHDTQSTWGPWVTLWAAGASLAPRVIDRVLAGAAFARVQIGVGAAGSESPILDFRTQVNSAGNYVALPPGIVIPPGHRAAARIMAGAGMAISPAGHHEPTVRRPAPLLFVNDVGVNVSSGWTQILASTPYPYRPIAVIQHQSPAHSSGPAFEVGVGASGSEVLVGIIPHGYTSSPGPLMPIIPAGSRLSLRPLAGSISNAYVAAEVYP